MFKKTVFFLIVLINTTIQAQNLTSFTLADYRYRTEGFRSATLSAGLNSQGNNQGATSGVGLTPNKNNRFTSFAVSGTSTFFNTRSLDSRQTELILVTQMDVSYNKAKFDTSSRKNSFNRLTTDYTLTERFYKSNNNYIEFSGQIMGGGTRSVQDQSSGSFSNNNNLNASIFITAGVGHGRLENVADAQMALFILQDLQKNGLLEVSTVDKQLAYNFAALITKIRNTRLFDFRRRRLFELNTVDSFLVANKLIKPSDFRSFNVINDNWAFAIQVPDVQATGYVSGGISNILTDPSVFSSPNLIEQAYRFSGFRKYAKLELSNAFANNVNKTEIAKTTTKLLNPIVGVIVGLEQHSPLSLQWQRVINAYARTFYTSNQTTSNGTKTKSNTLSYNLTATYGMEYIPNTRSQIRMGAGINALYNKVQKLTVSVGGDFIANYFINYRSRLAAIFNFQTTPISKTDQLFLINFSVGYAHALY